MSDMTPQQAADELAQGFPGRALRILIDHARATAPEDGDLAEIAKLLDSHAAISDRPGQLDQLEALAARVRAHRCAPSVAAPPREDREALIPSIERALFGTTDGDLLNDEDATVPVGEFRRLLRDVWAGTVRDPERAT